MFWLWERKSDESSDINRHLVENSAADGELENLTERVNSVCVGRLERQGYNRSVGRKKHWNIWRWVCLCMGFFFFLAAYVQHNDPDPFVWITAYLVPCLISWTISLTPFSKWGNLERNLLVFGLPCLSTTLSLNLDKIILLHTFFCFCLGAWTLLYFWSVKMTLHGGGGHGDGGVEPTHNWGTTEWNLSEEGMAVEEAKELLGLCLVIGWLSLIKNRNFMHFGTLGTVFGVLFTALPILSWIIVAIYEGEEINCQMVESDF